MSGEETLRRLTDLEAIRDLARRYAHCVWKKDVTGAIELFTEDGVMEIGGRPAIRGRPALLESYREMIGGMLQPFVHNHVIELEGSRASATCYLDLRATVEGRSMIGAGWYEDEYVRDGEAWRFRSRKLTLSYFVPLDEGWADG
jgi:hypothetical protein